MGFREKIDQSKTFRMLVNFAENTVAYALPVFFQQFIVYPIMARKLGAESNGLFLALIALNYFVVNLTATILVNTRLLRKNDYESAGVRGDYNLILLCFAVVNSAAIIVGTLFYMGKSATPTDVVLSVILALLFLFQNYIVVQYRSELKFNKILIDNVIICVGYLIGLALLYYVVPYWQIVFIVPYAMTFVYDWFNTDYIREPLKRTPLFAGTARQYFILLGSSLLTTMVTYGDRLLLYPLMDGTSVSILTSAQLIGKMMQMISTPLASFFLAYIVNQRNSRLEVKARYVIIGIVASVLLYLACVIISGPMLRYLYPGWANQSQQLVTLTAATGVFHMISVIANVVALKFCESKWQIVKGAVYLATYMIFSFVLLRLRGLTGFCIGNVLASAVDMVFVFTLLFRKRVLRVTSA